MKRPEDYRPANYLCGKDRDEDSPYDAAWESSDHPAPQHRAWQHAPRQRTFMERNSWRMLILSLVALGALGFASFIVSRWV